MNFSLISVKLSLYFSGNSWVKQSLNNTNTFKKIILNEEKVKK